MPSYWGVRFQNMYLDDHKHSSLNMVGARSMSPSVGVHQGLVIWCVFLDQPAQWVQILRTLQVGDPAGPLPDNSGHQWHWGKLTGCQGAQLGKFDVWICRDMMVAQVGTCGDLGSHIQNWWSEHGVQVSEMGLLSGKDEAVDSYPKTYCSPLGPACTVYLLP